jgi:TonB-dependent SusC/RagA subfamily outer membrane receptor
VSKHVVRLRGLGAALSVLAVLPAAACGPAVQQSSSAAPDTAVIGYGTQARKDLTSSVTSLPSEPGTVSIRMEDLLEGRVAGVEIIHLASGKISLRIRGSNTLNLSSEPLYVIDGTPVHADNFTDAVSGMNPQSVARIDILKDAGSTAIYGSAGANGVVLITTKRGPD